MTWKRNFEILSRLDGMVRGRRRPDIIAATAYRLATLCRHRRAFGDPP